MMMSRIQVLLPSSQPQPPLPKLKPIVCHLTFESSIYTMWKLPEVLPYFQGRLMPSAA